jgi:hypothetical protein
MERWGGAGAQQEVAWGGRAAASSPGGAAPGQQCSQAPEGGSQGCASAHHRVLRRAHFRKLGDDILVGYAKQEVWNAHLIWGTRARCETGEFLRDAAATPLGSDDSSDYNAVACIAPSPVVIEFGNLEVKAEVIHLTSSRFVCMSMEVLEVE